MILQCAACNARFLVPDAAIGTDGRTVRCGRCRHLWFVPGVTPPPDFDEVMREGADIATAPPAGLAADARAHVPAVVENSPPWALMTAAGILLVLVVLATLLAFAPRVLGMPPSTGLTLRGIALQAQAAAEGSGERYALQGEIVNQTVHEARAPLLQVSVFSKDNALLKRWQVVMPQRLIPPYGSLHFSDPAAAIPAQAGLRLRVEMGSRLELLLRKLK
ncbi:MAG: zinc-ribbon domain-containing protein [Alphaproteobacteria bacterium]|nr:zinc-ribbon domain-containing protein [Alphaproteobacteria bacterium]